MTPVASPPNSATNAGIKAVRFPEAGGSATITATSSTWLLEVENRMLELLELRAGWDTYEAPPIDSHYVAVATEVVHELARIGVAVAPAVVPTPRGGVQLEWHVADLGLEISIDHDGGRLLVVDDAYDFEDDVTGPGAERALQHALGRLMTS
jgi:hypothetical protein